MSATTNDTDYDGSPEAIIALGELIAPQHWQPLSSCSQTNPETFFPRQVGTVHEPCLDWALTSTDQFGLASGTSERQCHDLGRTAEEQSQVQLEALQSSGELRTEWAKVANTSFAVSYGAKPTTTQTPLAVPNITPATSTPMEV